MGPGAIKYEFREGEFNERTGNINVPDGCKMGGPLSGIQDDSLNLPAFLARQEQIKDVYRKSVAPFNLIEK